jgi:protocatechuate 3,4-dioxygenase beta subunit
VVVLTSGLGALSLMGCDARGPATAQPTPAQRVVGGGIDGPDGWQGVPAGLSWQDTSPGWTQQGQRIKLTGTILQSDARTPAPGIVLYYYHTNTQGRYIHNPAEPRSMPPNELGQTHGAIRGWVKTGADGRYEILTVRPGTYPTRDAPDHVHATIKEPGLDAYYIDDFVFDDDPLLTAKERRKLENRCGSGVLRLVKVGDRFVGERDIILGRNIPGHPGAKPRGVASGPNIGEDVVSFTPRHAWGPDKGTSTCPVCKYGWYHGVLYVVAKDPNWPEIKSWLAFFERESAAREDRLKVYFVYADPRGYNAAVRERELEALGRELVLKHVALTFVPSVTDEASEVALNRISPDVGSTMILYRRSRVIGTMLDAKPTPENFARVRERLDRTRNEYFDVPK